MVGEDRDSVSGSLGEIHLQRGCAYRSRVEGDVCVGGVLSVPDGRLPALVAGRDQLTVERERYVVHDRGEVFEGGDALGRSRVVEMDLGNQERAEQEVSSSSRG